MPKYRKFGNTDMEISATGVGAWAMGGGDWAFAWGSQEDKESIDAIHTALDAGVNWIDTAAVYGLGHSEKVVGKAVKESPHNPYIFTKCSLTWDKDGNIINNLNKDSIRKEVEASLKRLDVETIDLYQIHWPNPDDDIEEGWETLLKLKEEGKIRWAGVSNFSVEQIERISGLGKISTLQPPYSAINRKNEPEVLPYCLENNIGVIVYSPMQAGLLTGKMTKDRIASFPDDDWRKRTPQFQEPNIDRNLALQDFFVEIARENNVMTPQIAIAWVLHNKAVTGAIVGMRNKKQAEEITKNMDFRLNKETYERIANFITENYKD